MRVSQLKMSLVEDSPTLTWCVIYIMKCAGVEIKHWKVDQCHCKYVMSLGALPQNKKITHHTKLTNILLVDTIWVSEWVSEPVNILASKSCLTTVIFLHGALKSCWKWWKRTIQLPKWSRAFKNTDVVSHTPAHTMQNHHKWTSEHVHTQQYISKDTHSQCEQAKSQRKCLCLQTHSGGAA